MTAKFTVIFFIVLCLEAGIALTLLPWITAFGIGDWGDNYLLVYVTSKTGLPILRQTVASGWVRGAVTALGVFNLVIAFWEIAHFNRTVRALENQPPTSSDEARKNGIQR